MNASPSHLETSLPVIVVGAGPIGIETAVHLSQSGFQVRMVDAGCVGATIDWWARGTRWFSSNDRISIAGIPLDTVDQAKASREEYLTYLRGIVRQFKLPVQTFTRVVDVQPNGDASVNVLGQDSRHDNSEGAWKTSARAVVLATGGTDHANRLGVPGEDLSHVDGYLRDVHRYFGRKVVIVGGRNSAVEAAIRLHRVGADVSLVYHGPSLPNDSIKYWLRPEMEGLIQSGAIATYFDSRVIAIDESQVQIEVSRGDDSKTLCVAADDVLKLIGYYQDTRLWESLGIELSGDNRAPVFDPETMLTNRPRIYVAGTAVGGTQSSHYRIFVENCHVHATRITQHLLRCDPPKAVRPDEGKPERSSAVMPAHRSSHDPAAELARRVGMMPES
ncbi:MAG: NAD(P)-binding domain-containing protein [Planctomycetota bacterium]